MVEVWTAALTDAPADLERRLSAVDRQRAEAFVDHRARRLFVLGRVLLPTVLAHRLNGDRTEPMIIRRCPVCGGNDHGQPAAPSSGLALSIAHAGTQVVVALTSQPAVGIDIEPYPTPELVDEIATTVLSVDERHWLAAQRDRDLGFALLWTRKEAAAKCTGIGLLADLPTLEVLRPTLEVPRPTGGYASVNVFDLPAAPGYALALALEGETGDPAVDLEDAAPLLRG